MSQNGTLLDGLSVDEILKLIEEQVALAQDPNSSPSPEFMNLDPGAVFTAALNGPPSFDDLLADLEKTRDVLPEREQQALLAEAESARMQSVGNVGPPPAKPSAAPIPMSEFTSALPPGLLEGSQSIPELSPPPDGVFAGSESFDRKSALENFIQNDTDEGIIDTIIKNRSALMRENIGLTPTFDRQEADAQRLRLLPRNELEAERDRSIADLAEAQGSTRRAQFNFPARVAAGAARIVPFGRDIIESIAGGSLSSPVLTPLTTLTEGLPAKVGELSALSFPAAAAAELGVTTASKSALGFLGFEAPRIAETAFTEGPGQALKQAAAVSTGGMVLGKTLEGLGLLLDRLAGASPAAAESFSSDIAALKIIEDPVARENAARAIETEIKIKIRETAPKVVEPAVKPAAEVVKPEVVAGNKLTGAQEVLKLEAQMERQLKRALTEPGAKLTVQERRLQRIKKKLDAARARAAQESAGRPGKAQTPPVPVRGVSVPDTPPASPASLKAAARGEVVSSPRRVRSRSEARGLIQQQISNRDAPGSFQEAPGAPGVSREIPKSFQSESVPAKGKGLIGPQNLIARLERGLGAPFRIGRLGGVKGQRAGQFDVRQRVARLARANDLVTAGHEAGHVFEGEFFRVLAESTDAPADKIANELLKLGQGLYPTEPPNGYLSEGFAEFIRTATTQFNEQAVAPETAKFFNEIFARKQPSLAKAITRFRDGVEAFARQSPEQRLGSKIDFPGNKPFKGPVRERIRNTANRLRTLLESDTRVLEDVTKQMKGGLELPADVDPAVLARNFQMSTIAKVQAFVESGPADAFGARIKDVKPLAELLKPVTGRLEDFSIYTTARRAKFHAEQGIDDGFDLKDVAFVLDRFKNDTAMKTAADDFQKLGDAALDYLVDAGGLSAEGARVVRALNPIYSPMMRVFQESVGRLRGRSGPGLGRKLGDIGSPLKKAKGSGRNIRVPMEAVVEQIGKIISTADRVRTARALVDLAKKRGGMGIFIEDVTEEFKTIPHEFKLKDIVKQLKDLGVETPEGPELDELLTVFSQRRENIKGNKENIISLWIGGEQKHFALNPQLFDAMNFAQAEQLPIFLHTLLVRPARLVKFGALNPLKGWPLSNIFRDTQDFMVQTKNTRGTPDLVAKALFDRLRGGLQSSSPAGVTIQQMKASGAEMSNLLSLTPRDLQRSIEMAMLSGTKAKALHIAAHPIDMFLHLAEASGRVLESAPRLAEVKGVLKKHGYQLGDVPPPNVLAEMTDAFNRATINFKESGSLIRPVNQVIPFFNANFQGPRTGLRRLRVDPVKTALRAVAKITVPTLALWWVNKDKPWYKRLPAWRKYGFYNIAFSQDPDNPFILSIPRSFFWGWTFGSIPEAVMNDRMSQFKGNKEVVSATKQLFKMSTPDLLPTAFKVPTELYTNFDFFRGRPIVPPSEQGFDPPAQFGNWTTEFSKALGKLTRQSPRMIDQFLSSSTGGLAPEAVRGIEAGLRKIGVLVDDKKRDGGFLDMALIRRFVGRPLGPNAQPINDLFDRSEKLEAKLRTFRKGRGPALTFDERAELLGTIRPSLKGIRRLRRIIENRDRAAAYKFWLDIVRIAEDARKVRQQFEKARRLPTGKKKPLKKAG